MSTCGSAEEPSPLSAREWVVWLALYLVLLAVDLWLVFVVAHGAWQDKVSLVLAIVGFFGLGVGLLSRSEFNQALPGLIDIDRVTSHNLARFLGGNFRALAASTEFMRSFIFGPDPWSRPDMAIGWTLALAPLSIVSFLVVVAAWLLFFVAVAAYLVIVMPFAYLAYALVSLPLLRIQGADETQHPPAITGVHPSAIVKNNLMELRIFTVGVISPLFAFMIKLVQLY